MNQEAASSLISLLVVALVARRELRASTAIAGKLWIRPGVISAVTALLLGLAAFDAPDRALVLIAWLIGGIVVGAATGAVLLRFTTIRDAERPDAVIVKGSIATVAVWLVVLGIRVGARWLFGGTSAASNIDASVGTVAVVAAASVVLAAAYQRAISARRSP
jgi:hypothetical protein